MDEERLDPERSEHGEVEAAPVFRCAACGATIAAAEDEVPLAPSTPVFANPAGVVFELITVSRAPGAVPATVPDPRFSWFPGYAWQIGVCAACRAHVGWRFVGPGQSPPTFWGLIRDRVVLRS